jgi:hypothetical protein
MAEDKQDEKYQTLNTSDHIRAISELEHIYSHAMRSKQVAWGTDDEVFYQVIANKAKALRRKYMRTYFPDCDDKLWCLGKASASLRQVMYEADEGNTELLKDADDIVDSIWGKISGKDLSDCEACKSDRKE